MRYLFQDLIRLFVLVLVCSLLGGMMTYFYPSKLIPSISSSLKIISLNEFQEMIQQNDLVIFDARPHTFYQLGHIPKALNLSRNEFEKDLRFIREKIPYLHTKKLIVYCSDSFCDDSRKVAEKLIQAGLRQVSVFEGGWAEWQEAGLVEEKGE